MRNKITCYAAAECDTDERVHLYRTTAAMVSLVTLIERMKSDHTFADLWERDAIGVYIVPILENLGWPIDDKTAVKREYKIGMGRVDFFLTANNGYQMLLEAKRPSQNLSDHERQLLLYAFEEGVPFAALTNARQWWLYSSLKPGHWRRRKFCAVDLLAESAASGSQSLLRFLQRSNVESAGYDKVVAASLDRFRQDHPLLDEPEEPEFSGKRIAQAPTVLEVAPERSGKCKPADDSRAGTEYRNPYPSGTKMRQVFEALRESWVTGNYLTDLTGQKGGWQRWVQKHYVESGRYGDMLLLWKKNEKPSPMHLAPRLDAESMLGDPCVSIYPE